MSGKRDQLAEEEEAARLLTVKHTLSKFFGLSYTQKISDNALLRSIQRWRDNVYKIKRAALREKLDDLTVSINDIIAVNDDLEEKNMALATENEELRQLSLESVELAKVRFKPPIIQ